MNSSLSRSTPPKNLNSVCADLVTMAEQELSAFFRAVTELFGTEQAELSAEDWLREFTAIDSLPASARELRRITAKASTRLATRVNASSLLPELQSL
jgi:hypothetical protein